MSNRLQKHTYEEEGDTRRPFSRIRKALAVVSVASASALAGVGIGTTIAHVAKDTHEVSAPTKESLSEGEKEELRREVDHILHRFDSCSVAALEDSQTVPENVYMPDIQDRTTVNLQLHVQRNDAAVPTEKKYAHDDTIVWDPASLIVEAMPAGETILLPVPTPYPEIGLGYAFEGEDSSRSYMIDGPLEQTIPVKVYPRHQDDGAKLTFSVRNRAYSPWLNDPYDDQPTYQQPCGTATMVNGKWQLDLPS